MLIEFTVEPHFRQPSAAENCDITDDSESLERISLVFNINHPIALITEGTNKLSVIY